MVSVPKDLGLGGKALFEAISGKHDLDAAQVAQLTEACRAKDRLDKLDALLRGEIETWAVIFEGADEKTTSLRIDAALQRANDCANLMKQLLAALRLPDEASGKRPQHRGARGAQKPTVPGGQVSSLDRARAAKSS